MIRKAPIESGTKRLSASRAQNDALEAARSHSAQLRIEKFKAQRKEILMRSLSVFPTGFCDTCGGGDITY